MQDDVRQAVFAAAARSDALAAVADVYADVQRAIDARRPTCLVSGRCCKFDEFGHRLYVSTLELAAFVAQHRQTNRTRLPILNNDPGGCPFQVAKLCTVHTHRPFGCRMFFCDATATDWQNAQYERFHARLKQLHDDLQIPYFYVEWRWALQTLDLPLLAAVPKARA